MKPYHWILLPVAVVLMLIFREGPSLQGAEEETCSSEKSKVITLTRSQQANMFRVMLKEKQLAHSINFHFYSDNQSEQITLSWADQQNEPVKIELLDEQNQVLTRKWLLPGQQYKDFELSSYPPANYMLLVKKAGGADSYLIEKK